LPVYFFRALEEAAAGEPFALMSRQSQPRLLHLTNARHLPTSLTDAMRAAETLTLSVLLDATLQAASAVLHANWQRGVIASAVSHRQETNVPLATDVAVVANVSETSLRFAIVTLEALLTTWLAHAVAFPVLRLSKDETMKVLADADLVDALSFSPFSVSLCERIQEMISDGYENS
jgi:hypothetical protein